MSAAVERVSVSLPARDLKYLSSYVDRHGLPSRSAGVHEAIQLLRERELEEQYVEAYREWDESGEGAVWDAAAGDGLEMEQ